MRAPTLRPAPPRRRRALVAPALVAALLTPAAPALAQGRLVGLRSVATGPVFESWSFGDGLYQPLFSGSDSVRLRSASRLSIPVSVTVPLGSRFSVDVTGAYTTGRVELREPGAALGGATALEVSGLTDTKVRLTGRLAGENLVFTLGYNAPSGRTKLSAEQLEALRVIASPALGFTNPTLGNGGGGTAGVVYARDLRGLSWALGASYELRSRYTPAATIAGGLPSFGYAPSDAVHLSLAVDGLVRGHGMTAGVSADLYGDDTFTPRAAAPDGAVPLAAPDAEPLAATTARLGPVFTAEWELRVATSRLRELTVYAVDRYRTRYRRGGATVAASDGNYLDAGVRTVVPLGTRLGLLAAANLRHQTGLQSDNALAAAAAASGGLTLGLTRDFGAGYVLQPFVRGQAGRIESGAHRAAARSGAGGVTVVRRSLRAAGGRGAPRGAAGLRARRRRG